MGSILLVPAFLYTYVCGTQELFIIPCQCQESSQTTYTGCQTCRWLKLHKENTSCVGKSLNHLLFKDPQILPHAFLHWTSQSRSTDRWSANAWKTDTEPISELSTDNNMGGHDHELRHLEHSICRKLK